jgi:hypothetical protein
MGVEAVYKKCRLLEKIEEQGKILKPNLMCLLVGEEKERRGREL